MKKSIILSVFLMALPLTHALGNATIPKKDISGAQDSPMLKRVQGSFIVSYEKVPLTNFTIPLSPLEKTDTRDAYNNILYKPQQEIELEGQRTRIAYFFPMDKSTLEVRRYYESAILASGGEILYSCRIEACGGDAGRGINGSGGRSSLLMYFVDERALNDPSFSNGACAFVSQLTDQTFLASVISKQDSKTYITVHTFQIIANSYCKAFNGKTIAIIHILEEKQRSKLSVMISSEQMAKSLVLTGHTTLYGILFDPDKTEVKPLSEPTLAEIANMLNADPKLSILIVGHTDNEGGFDYNIELSHKRAEAVVSHLVSTYQIDPKRLQSAGAGMMAPLVPNNSDSNRGKNRRVEIVKLN